MVAAIAAGASLLSNFLQMRAQEEAERKEREQEAYKMQMENAKDTGGNQNAILANLMNNYRATLMG